MIWKHHLFGGVILFRTGKVSWIVGVQHSTAQIFCDDKSWFCRVYVDFLPTVVFSKLLLISPLHLSLTYTFPLGKVIVVRKVNNVLSINNASLWLVTTSKIQECMWVFKSLFPNIMFSPISTTMQPYCFRTRKGHLCFQNSQFQGSEIPWSNVDTRRNCDNKWCILKLKMLLVQM